MFKVGDNVYILSTSGFGDDSESKIIEESIRYDEIMGKSYKIFKTESGHWFKENGFPCTPPWGYTMRPVLKKDEEESK